MFKNIILLLLLVVLNETLIFSQRGVLGNQTITDLQEWVNTYTHLSANANIGETSITVDDNIMTGAFFTGDLDAGDLILIIQMQGASMDVNTTAIGWGATYTAQNSWSSFGGSNPEWDPSEFGQVLNYNNAGNFEYVEVAAVNGGNTIELNCALTKDYTAAHHVQIVRIPRFESLIIENGASIESPQWNGISGGIVAIEVDQDLTLNGTGRINVSNQGFRGGIAVPSNTMSGDTNSSGFLGSSDSTEGSEKGEGIGGFYTEYDAIYSRYCRGALANGGGGSNYHNAGGGGGSNVGVGTFTSSGVPDPGATNQYVVAWDLDDPDLLANPSSGGGRGGYSHATINNDPFVEGPMNEAWNGDNRRTSFGVGGHALTYNPERIFMGGGGGSGHQNDGQGGDGSRGGGIVMLQVYGEILGDGSIIANGEDGEDATGPTPGGFGSKTGDDGAGGAGGGGAIHIFNNNNIPATVNLIAEGGNGGNQNLQLSTGASNQADGPGGGGAGGMIAFSNGTPNQSVAGGVGGTTNSSFVSNFPFNGATGGALGMDGLNVDFFDLIVENDTLCGGTSTTLIASLVGVLPSDTEIEWYDSQFGGVLQETGTSFTTPSLTSSTTYYVGTCPGTYRKEVQVIISPTIEITGIPSIVDESCLGNDGSITGLSASGGSGQLEFDWSGVTTTSEDLTNAVGGNYTLTITDELGCAETAGPYVIDASGPTIDISNVVIANESCNGDDGSITGISTTGTGLIFEWNGITYPSEDIVGVVGGDYTLVVTDDNGCTSNAGPFTIETEPGPSVDTSNMIINDESCVDNDGSITGIAASGTNLSYEWNGVSYTSTDLEDVVAGSYTLIVTNNSTGCTTTVGPYDIEYISGPTIDETNLLIENEACDQENGSISGLNASGSNLSYEWNGSLVASEDLTNLSEGTYTLVATDDSGCTATSGPHEVENLSGPLIDLSNLSIQGESCIEYDGAITGITVVGSGLIYTWNFTNNTPTADFTGLSAGTYVLQVEDENGCTAEAGPFELNYNPGPTIDDTDLEIFDETCIGFDGAIIGLDVTGTGLLFEWNGITSTTADLENIPVGTYNLVVTDDNGCSASYGPIDIGGTSPPVISLSADTIIEAGGTASLSVLISPNQPGAIIEWSPGNGLSCTVCANPEASPSETTAYIVTVFSEEGCLLSDTVSVTIEENCGGKFVPTIFSPNADGENDDFCALGSCIATMQLAVFNRWGERVFYSESQEECWDGTYNGEPLNTGVFVYKISGTLYNGKSFSDVGNLTLVR